MFTCEFNVSTSVRPDFYPKFCGNTAEFSYDGVILCRRHYFVESGRVVICQSCGNPDYDSYSAMREIHSNTCSLWLQGVDCMHGENEDYCGCEDEARQKFQDAVDAVEQAKYEEEVDIAEQHGDRVW